MSAISDRAYDIIRKRIVSGELAPGVRLKERNLCGDLDMSRTPVREALKRLNSEGLVVTRPHRGMTVAELDAKEVDEIFELGAILESYAAGLAAGKARPEDITALQRLVDDMDSTLKQTPRDYSVYLERDQQFHEMITNVADNSRLAVLIRQTVSVRVVHQAYQQYKPVDFDYSLEQHRTILRAIAARDPEWASAAMGCHIREGRRAAGVADSRALPAE